jgi:hypothetical protein
MTWKAGELVYDATFLELKTSHCKNCGPVELSYVRDDIWRGKNFRHVR